MKIGLIDVDSHNFPNLPLMKISAYHKRRGDSVEWYEPLWSGHCDTVYVSKVFSFSRDYPYYIDADKVVKGGTGYCIELINGREVYHKENDVRLPDEIEHIYPDYSLYPELTKDTAYGFLTRGCPRGCGFCHVGNKEGLTSYKAADLTEFWDGQRNIKLLDPNILAYKGHAELLRQLIDSGSRVDFTQGLDIRLVNEQNISLITRIKAKTLHFAWDNPNENLTDKFRMFKEYSKMDARRLLVYVLTNYDSTHDEDLYRIYTLDKLGYTPYVMIYDKEHAPPITRRLQRWCNNKFIFRTVRDFSEYDPRRG